MFRKSKTVSLTHDVTKDDNTTNTKQLVYTVRQFGLGFLFVCFVLFCFCLFVVFFVVFCVCVGFVGLLLFSLQKAL